MASRKRSKDEEINLDAMFDVLEEQHSDLEQRRRSFDLIPPGWNKVGKLAPVKPKKTKLNLLFPSKSNISNMTVGSENPPYSPKSAVSETSAAHSGGYMPSCTSR